MACVLPNPANSLDAGTGYLAIRVPHLDERRPMTTTLSSISTTPLPWPNQRELPGDHPTRYPPARP